MITDFCTLWPDKLFGISYGKPCCVPHDRAYILGGVLRKLKADFELAMCVREESKKAKSVKEWTIMQANAVVMYLGVSTFGWYPWIQERYLQKKYYGSSDDEL